MTDHKTSLGANGVGNGKFDVVALRDLMVVVATLVLVKRAILPLSGLYAGPASTFSAMVMATLLLKRRASGWKDLGLRWPESWIKTAGLTLLAVFALAFSMELMELFADRYFTDQQAGGRFDHIQGNFLSYLVIMVLVWTHASFFEELLFRAFVINTTSRTLGGGLRADLMAVVLSAVFFGYRHYYYQGMNGALTTGAAGFAFALLYLWFGRTNILPLVLAHGVVNSIGMTLRYLGIDD